MQEIYSRVVRHLVGRREETRMILAAVLSGRHVMIEGPPGTSKSTILKSIVREMDLPFIQVTGNSDLTATKLIGHFDPAETLSKGYDPEHFHYGPVTEAMRTGAMLYVEEFNRLPEEASNVLIGAISERELTIPWLGTVAAKPTFRIVAALNPYDDAGTVRVSRALHDRFCSIRMEYQSREEEIEIVRQQVGDGRPDLIEAAVEMARRTRSHDDVRLGASVRAAIDTVLIARELSEFGDGAQGGEMIFASALMSLRDKIWLNETTSRSPDEVLREIWQGVAAKMDIPRQDASTPEDLEVKKKSMNP